MAVRPFYMSADIEGRADYVTGGPRSKTGRQDIVISQRDRGESIVAFTIKSNSFEKDGKLWLRTIVRDTDGFEVARHETEY